MSKIWYFQYKLKTAVMTSIFKGGDGNSLIKYSPISLLPALSKIVYHYIKTSYLSENSLLLSSFG